MIKVGFTFNILISLCTNSVGTYSISYQKIVSEFHAEILAILLRSNGLFF